jgi:hypothetical protein
MSADLEIIEDPPYPQDGIRPKNELRTGAVVYAIISQYDRIAREAVVLCDHGETVDVCPTIPGRRFCHTVSRMVVRGPDELYPEQIQAKTQWKKLSAGSQYACANCNRVSRTHPRDIPFTSWKSSAFRACRHSGDPATGIVLPNILHQNSFIVSCIRISVVPKRL